MVVATQGTLGHVGLGNGGLILPSSFCLQIG